MLKTEKIRIGLGLLENHAKKCTKVAACLVDFSFSRRTLNTLSMLVDDLQSSERTRTRERPQSETLLYYSETRASNGKETLTSL